MTPHAENARPRFTSAIAAGVITLIATGSLFAQVESSQTLGRPQPLVNTGDPDVKQASSPLVEEAPTQENLARLAAVIDAQQSRKAPHAAAKPVLPAKMAPRTRITEVAYDIGVDGSLWVRGAGYKASFNSDGFTFIPYLGSSAPQNYPVHFRLVGIDVGGQPLALQAPTVTRDGDRITIDRGPVQEVYHITLASIEQQFIFSQRPGVGQANILMNVDTELAASDAGEQIEFSNDRGAVRYTRAITVDANDLTADSPTSYSNGQIAITVPADVLNNAAYPLVVDPIITPFIADGSDEVNDRGPDASYDATDDGYLLVWENRFSVGDHDVATERYNWNGIVEAGSFAWVDFTSEHWRNVSVANNNNSNNHLVVGEVGADGSRQVWGRIRSAINNTLGSKVQISGTATGEQYNADVGGDPFDGFSYYVVVWQRNFSATDRDIFCRRIDPVTGATAGDVVLIENSGGTLYQNPSISKSKVAAGEEWMVVYEFANNPVNVDIYGALIAWDGTIAQANFSVDSSIVNNRNPAVSSRMDNGMYMVVYEEDPTGLGDIYSRVFDGTLIQAAANLTALEGVQTAANRRMPSIDSDGQRQVVAIAQQFSANDWDPYVSTYCLDGSTIRVAEQHRNLDYTGSDTANTNVACAHATAGFYRETMLTFDTVSTISGVGTIEGAFYLAKSSCCISDVNDDGTTNVTDLLQVIADWSSFDLDALGDVNGDLQINVSDLLAVIAAWGACP